MSEEKEPEQPVLEGELVEEVPEAPAPAFDYTDAGVPTFDYVRDRITNKVSTSIGATELAEESPEGQSVEQQMAERDRAGLDKLEQIRRSMRGE